MLKGFGFGAERGVCSKRLRSRAGEMEKGGGFDDSEALMMLGVVGVSPMPWPLEVTILFASLSLSPFRTD